MLKLLISFLHLQTIYCNMINYEIVFLANPVLSDQQLDETSNKYLDFLKNKKSEIAHFENWGLKKLAYAIQHKTTAFYFLIQITTVDVSILSELETLFKRDERVLRWLVTKMDKHAIKYSDRRRSKLDSKKAEKNKKK